MSNPYVGQIIGPNEARKVSELPADSILVSVDDNKPHTRSSGISYFTDATSGHVKFRVAYIPTPKPEPLFPLSFVGGFNGRTVKVEESLSSSDGAKAFLAINSTGEHLTSNEARKVAHALLAVIGEHPAKTVYSEGDEEPKIPGLVLKDRDGDFWHYTPTTSDAGYNWAYRANYGSGNTPTRGSDSWSAVLRYAPLTVVNG